MSLGIERVKLILNDRESSSKSVCLRYFWLSLLLVISLLENYNYVVNTKQMHLIYVAA